MNHIMLIEDDRTIQNLLKIILELEGFSVTVCNSTQSAEIKKQIISIQPDILILDVNLHEINGIQLLLEIRASREVNHIKVIMTSGMELKEECLSAGANAFLLKPFMPDDLIGLLKSAG